MEKELINELDDIFEEYEKLVSEVDLVFDRVKAAHPKEVKCAVGCCDCCYALFDLSLVEAMYLNKMFRERFPDTKQREQLQERANKVDRQIYKFKRELYKKRQEGVGEQELMQMVGEKRIRCALLNDSFRCDLYEQRPITCRLYGIPLAIGGTGKTCIESGFKAGGQYPTVQVEKIQARLSQLSQAIVDAAQSSQQDLATALAPLSQALLNEYDDEYLGVPQKDDKDAANGQSADGPVEWTLGGGEDKK